MTEPERKSPRRTIVVSLVAVLALVAALVPIGWLSWDRPLRAREARLSRALDADVAAFHRHAPRPRPVPHGRTAEHCNGGEEVARVFATAPHVSVDGDAIHAAIHEGRTLGDDDQREAARFETTIEALHAATRCDESWTPTPGLTTGAMREWLPFVRIARRDLALDVGGPPDACLTRAVETIAYAQAIEPGESLVAAMLAASVVDSASEVASRCGAHASPEARAAASADAAALAASAPAFEDTLAYESLFVGVGMRATAHLVAEHPFDWRVLPPWRRGSVLDAWEELARLRSTTRGVGAATYPGSLATVVALDARLAASTNPFVAMSAPDYTRYVVKDMKAQARLRALALALAPDAHLSLRDPFDGAPMRVAPADGLAWSVGENGRDEHGEGDDVAVHLGSR